jgi:hypothetical protein
MQLGRARRSPKEEHPPPSKLIPPPESSAQGSNNILPPLLTHRSRRNTAQGKEHRRRDTNTNNFRDFRPEDDPFEPRTFTSVPHNISPILSSHPEDYTSGPTGERVPFSRTNSDASDDLRTSQMADVAAEAFREKSPSFELPLRLAPVAHVSNISQSGIVHLPPIGSNKSSSRGSDRGSGPTSPKNKQSRHSARSSDRRRARSIKSDEYPPSPSSAGNPRSPRPGSQGGQSHTSSEMLTTVRYQHAQDVNGNHIVIGREGHISRCEDEVRDFSSSYYVDAHILSANSHTGRRTGFRCTCCRGRRCRIGNSSCAAGLRGSSQCPSTSQKTKPIFQNSLELLGLSAKFLFSLECFTDTFSESQSEILWDNVQFLNDTSPSVDEAGDSPHVFMISGYGAPGTDESSKDPLKRREWTCWCAAHRPAVPDGRTGSSLVILEFELERDVLNPLYPPSPSVMSVIPSPSSGSTSSGATLVARRSPGSDSAGSEGLSSLGSAVVRGDPMMLGGREEWMPSPEEILESTTSRARPLTALERLRRISRGTGTAEAVEDAGAGPGGTRRRNRHRKGTGGGVGMMDVFAVMAQINEQLGDAPDLESFLKVLVGVIQDLTQFHRVLVYQFDEAWNGQVVAELLDWSKTHELYKGLHFPAGDIPAQVR